MGKWVSSFHIAGNSLSGFYHCEKRTIRLIIPNNIRGEKLKLKLSNEYGDRAIFLQNIMLALSDNNGKIDLNTNRPLLFNGKSEVEILSGEDITSDEMLFLVEPGQFIAISIYCPHRHLIGSGNSIGEYALRSKKGNYVDSKEIATNTKYSLLLGLRGINLNTPIPFFKSLDIYTEDDVKVLSAFGDSIVSGAKWFTPLQNMIYRDFVGLVACGNTGISGNRLLRNSPRLYGNAFGEAGIKRFQKDVMGVEGISHLILAIGTNDLGYLDTELGRNEELPVPEDFINAYSKIIKITREKDIKTMVLSMLPRDDKDFNEEKDIRRIEINEALKNSGLFDHFVDLEEFMVDESTGKIREEYYNEDRLHINDLGGKVIAQHIDYKDFI